MAQFKVAIRGERRGAQRTFDSGISLLKRCDIGLVGFRAQFLHRLAPGQKEVPEEMRELMAARSKFTGRIGALMERSEALRYDESESFWRFV